MDEDGGRRLFHLKLEPESREEDGAHYFEAGSVPYQSATTAVVCVGPVVDGVHKCEWCGGRSLWTRKGPNRGVKTLLSSLRRKSLKGLL